MLDVLFQIITMMGEEIIIMAVIGYIYWNVDKKTGKYIGGAVLISACFNNFLKNIFKAKRPIGEAGIRTLREHTATGYSFPSGHSQGAGTVMTALMISFKKRWLNILLFVLMILVGVSRLYLGVHYPRDVVAGLSLGALISLVLYYVNERVLDINKIYIALMAAFMVIMVFCRTPDYIKSVAAFSGFVMGVLFEERFVKFEHTSGALRKIARLILGAAVMGLIKWSLGILLPNVLFFKFISYFLVTFVAIGIYPMLFKKLKI